MAARAPLVDPPAHAPRMTLPLLRLRHVALMKQMPGLPDDTARRAEAETMREDVAAAGAFLNDWAERDSAQSLIDYWTTVIAATPGAEGYPAMLDLAPFDPGMRPSLKALGSPFVGLNPFGRGDSDRFFGRAHAAHALLDVVTGQPLTVVSGPSGSGKSSLVLAGLLPLLAQRGDRPILPTVVPGTDPVAALLAAVRPELAAADWTDTERVALRRSPARLAELAEALPGGAQGVVLTIDQAQELFTFDIEPAARQTVFDALAAMIGRAAPHRLVLTIRSDYLGALTAVTALFPPAAQTATERNPAIFVPEPLTSRELHDAIVGPAERIGLRIDPAVVEDLVREVIGEPAALPLLQFTLSQLWSRAEIDCITGEDYAAVGKPSEALRRTAERLYAELTTGEDAEAARLVFLALIKPAQDAESVRRRVRRETLRKLAAEDRIDRVLEHFVAGGLLRRTPGPEKDDDRFEVAHETLIRHWPRLADWLEQRQRADAARERLLAAAEQWRKAGRERGYLLTGAALEQAAAYAGTARDLDEFIAASRQWQRFTARVRLAIAVAVACALLIEAGVVVWKWRDARDQAQKVESLDKRATALRDKARALGTAVAAEDGRATDAATLSLSAEGRALIAEQTLAHLLAAGTVAAADIPGPLLARLRPPPPASVAMMRALNGYDARFLKVALPLPAPRAGMVRLDYRNFSVLYDTAERLPVIAAMNVDRLAPALTASDASLPLDPRLPAALQTADFGAAGTELARVPLAGWSDVGWGDPLRPELAHSDFRPATVPQSWGFNQGPWADVSRAVLSITADRLVIASGPVLRADDPRVDGVRQPRAFWKLAAYRGPDDALHAQAYVVPVDAPVAGGVARFRVVLADLQAITGFDFTTAAGTNRTAAAKPLVYLQFAVMPRYRARAITAGLAKRGYIAPGEDRVQTATGLSEVRYFRREEQRIATRLADDTSKILVDLGFPRKRVTPRLMRLKTGAALPKPGVFELWLGMAAPDDGKAATAR